MEVPDSARRVPSHVGTIAQTHTKTSCTIHQGGSNIYTVSKSYIMARGRLGLKGTTLIFKKYPAPFRMERETKTGTRAHILNRHGHARKNMEALNEKRAAKKRSATTEPTVTDDAFNASTPENHGATKARRINPADEASPCTTSAEPHQRARKVKRSIFRDGKRERAASRRAEAASKRGVRCNVAYDRIVSTPHVYCVVGMLWSGGGSCGAETARS